MITTYIFNAANGELVSSTREEGSRIFRRVYFDDLDIEHLISTIVCEGIDAEREFFNHFGDDSSWPPGWWRAIGAPQFTKLRTKPMEFTRESWTRENHSKPKYVRRSWQEYFEVSCPDRNPLNAVPPGRAVVGTPWFKEHYGDGT